MSAVSTSESQRWDSTNSAHNAGAFLLFLFYFCCILGNFMVFTTCCVVKNVCNLFKKEKEEEEEHQAVSVCEGFGFISRSKHCCFLLSKHLLIRFSPMLLLSKELFFRVYCILKRYVSPPMPLLFSYSLGLPLCVFLCLTNTHYNRHTTRQAQLLLKPVSPTPPHSNFVRS